MIAQLLLAMVLTGVTVMMHAVGTVHIVLPLSGIWSKKGESRKSPAAVMPLTRDSSGKLGVRAQGGGDTFKAYLTINMPPSSGNQTQDKNYADAVGDSLQGSLDTWWEDRYRQAHRPGAIANGGVQL